MGRLTGQPEQREPGTGRGALLSALLPALAACAGNHRDQAPRPEPLAVSLQPALPGPLAPSTIAVNVHGEPYSGPVEIFDPSRNPDISPPAFVMSPGAYTIFPVAGAWTARMRSPTETLSATFPVSLDVPATMHIEAGGGVLGSTPTRVTLRKANGDGVSAFELRAYRLATVPGTVAFEQIPIDGQLAPLSTGDGSVTLQPEALLLNASDSVVYLQARSRLEGTVASPVWTPVLLPYEGAPNLPRLGVDFGLGGSSPHAGTTMTWRCQGVDLGCTINLYRLGVAAPIVTVQRLGMTSEVPVEIPTDLGTEIVRAEITAFRSDGTREWPVFFVICGK